ncbi:fatty acid-binding protein-like [Eurosta solidaginis]|uniref:fatty acid-binding protein-like n=1 Tax=Eurosta solidaginis TaxID=178769 RepID=UPI0035308D87
MSVWEGKKYTLVKNFGYEEYLKELGIDAVSRKILNEKVSTIELEQKSSLFSIKTTTDLGTTKVEFRLDEVVDEVTRDGREAKSSFHRERNNFIYHELCENSKPMTITMDFTNERLAMTLSVSNVEALQVYEAQPICESVPRTKSAAKISKARPKVKRSLRHFFSYRKVKTMNAQENIEKQENDEEDT